MEQEIGIKTPDKHIVYGTLNVATGNNERLIVFVHGLSGNQYEHQYFNAVPFFNQHGFDVFRFDFYARKPNARPLVQSTITTHAADLRSVIDHFRGKYQNITVVGHSLGALAILYAPLPGVSNIVLWDPTTHFQDIKEKNGSFNANIDKYILHWGMDILLSKEMVQEWQTLNLDTLIKTLMVPCKFIFAGDRRKYNTWKPYLEEVKVKTETVIIEGATHCFNEEGTEQKLFEETLDWLV